MKTIAAQMAATFFLVMLGISLYLATCRLVETLSDSPAKIEQDRHSQYQAWAKLYYRQDLTFEEWDTLRAGRYLDTYRPLYKESELP